MPFSKFQEFWNDLVKEFDCLNAADAKDAYENYLKEKLAIRFALKNTFIPNCEIKFPKTKYNNYSLINKVEVLLNSNKLNTSEIELQIAFKLKLGSEKDFEDARHLYKVFKEHLDIDLLKSHIKELMVQKEAERILWKNY